MKQTFECVEKHLYRRQYQTAGGDWSTFVLRNLHGLEKETSNVSGWIGSEDSKRGVAGAAGAKHSQRRLRHKGSTGGSTRAPYSREVSQGVFKN